MRLLLLSGVLALAVPAIALAQSPPPAAQYVAMAGQSDQFEIMTGKLAAEKGASASVKSFGTHMVTDHTKSTAMVTAAAKKSGLTVSPPALKSDQQAMFNELKAQSGAAFDKTYVNQQLKAHNEALTLQSGYAKAGDDANLKAAAAKIVPVVEMHIGMLKKMP